jgi:ankyrin repeat protein
MPKFTLFELFRAYCHDENNNINSKVFTEMLQGIDESVKTIKKKQKKYKYELFVRLINSGKFDTNDDKIACLEAIILSPNFDINYKLTSHNDLSLLHQACTSDTKWDVVSLLLKHGADPNIQNNDLWTPLHMTSKKEYKKLTKLLLAAGADPTIVNCDGDKPIEVNKRYMKTSVVEMLNQAKVPMRVTEGDSKGDTTPSVSNKVYVEENCVICNDAKPDMFFKSCKHICVCEDCNMTLSKKKTYSCPVCRKTVK